MAKNEIDSIILELKKDLLKVVDNNVDKSAKNVYKEETEFSYTLYEPVNDNTSRYRDGLDGSFADENNFESEVKLNNNGITYELVNHRQTDCDCDYCRAKRPYLDQFIEEGIAGEYFITPKKTYERTQDRIDSELVIENALESGLKKLGYDFD